MAATGTREIKRPSLKRFEAFTIIELMITLLISSTLMVLSYYTFFLVSRQFGRYRSRTAQIRDYRLMATAWQSDFDRAEWIRDSVESGGEQILFTHGDTLVRYSLHAGILVRVFRDRPDSFPLPASFNDILYLNDSLRLITSMRLNSIVNGEKVILTGEKIYSSAEIMQAENSMDMTNPVP